MTIYRGPGGTGEARTDTDITEVREIMIEAKGYRDEAQIAAAAAVTDADEAEAAADAAAVSAAAALVSQTSAAGSAATATAQAVIATDAADSAADSETAAAASAVAADASADAASLSEANAAVSASNASDSEIAADASADASAASATASASSAAAALVSQNSASSSASAASGSAAAALASQTAAAASAAAAAASFDNFDDRYLGAKSTDPSVDNDGNALLDGALYWNTVADEFRAWNGSGWESLTGLPSVTGQAGKFLFTNGSVASWATVPDPQPATPTNDGLVYGLTETDPLTTVGGWDNYTSSSIRFDGVQFETQSISTGAWNTWVLDNVNIGDLCYATTGGVRRYYGVVTAVGVNSGPGYSRGYFDVTNPENHPTFSSGTSVTFDSPLANVGGNVSLGYTSNSSVSSGANTVLGYGAGSTITTGSNLTVVGYDAEPSSATATNEATFGNSSTTKTRLFGSMAVGGSSTGSNGQFLKSTGASTAPEWSSLSTVATSGSYNDLTNKPTLPAAATPTDDGLMFGRTGSDALVTYIGWPTTYSITDSTVAGYWSEITSTSIQDYIPTNPSNLEALIAVAEVGDPIYVTYSGVTYYLGTYTNGTVTNLSGGGRAAEVYFNNTGGSGFTSNANAATYVISSPSSALGANVSVGYGTNNNAGGANTTVGYGAGSTITTGSNLTVVGYDAEPSSATAINEATFGNDTTTKTRIFGALAINNQTGTTGQVLTSNGSSAPTWQAPAAAPVTSVNTKTGAVVLTASDVGAATAAQGTNADTAFGWGDHALAGYAADSSVVKLTGDQTVAGTKTFSSTISGSITGNAGTVTNGVVTTGSYADPSWITSLAETKVLPSQTSQAGKYLTTNGTSTSWSTVDALPDQTGNAGEYLTTNGTTASWTPLNTDANTTTKGLYENNSVISANYTITTGNNAMSSGPITVNSGVTVTVPTGSRWVVI